MTMLPMNRRRFMMTSAAFGAAPFLMRVSPAAAASLTVGFIYVGPRDDFGYNQAHAEGAAAVKAMAGVTVIEEENVAETIDVAEDDGVDDQARRRVAALPDLVRLFQPLHRRHRQEVSGRPLPALRRAVEPTGPDERRLLFRLYRHGPVHLNGIVAGHMTKSKKIGFVAAKPIPQVLLNINSFLLGARAVDPAITCQVIFTGEWSLAVKEAEATNALVDQGADVITCHVDGPKVVVETAAGRGAYRLRLPRQPGAARAREVPHRRRVELGDGLHRCSPRRCSPARHCRTSCAAAWPRASSR